MRKVNIVIILSLLLFSNTIAQQKVEFYSEDSLKITADLYLQNSNYPYLILFHQANYSRGEYIETAQKFINLGYNCLAVDLRSGKEVNFIQNETAQRAFDLGMETNYLSSLPDMEAAINYVFQKSKKRVVILGSSYSASLCLYLAANNHKVKAAIAFSPGEYFNDKMIVRKESSKIRKPTYIAASKREEQFARNVAAEIPDNFKTIFIPTKGNGIHGSRALWKECDAFDEYWLSLTMFFIKIKDLK